MPTRSMSVNRRAGSLIGAVTPKTDFALHGAIIEGKEGSVFVKFTGPEKVVKGAHDKFIQFIADATKTKK